MSALWWSSILHLLLRDWQTAYTHIETGIRVAEEHGFTVLAVLGSLCRGWARSRLGYIGEGIEDLLHCRNYLSEIPNNILPWLFMALADACLVGRRQDEGLAAAASGLEFIDRTACRFNEAEIRRLEGELLLLDGNSTGAAECFEKAIASARWQNAKAWKLRASVSRARVLRGTGRRAEASAMLTDIYDWFTEGFDTADLKEAKALLDELGA
jgi:hypothetical protein